MTDINATNDFIQAHRGDDPRQLALQARRHPGVDMPYALDQISGWQTARHKLPSWAACPGVTYPPHLNMEQCSSEHTARYKAEVAARWARRVRDGGRTSMADLTGGFGVDFSFVSRAFDEATYVERDEALCRIARHNLPRLGIANARVVCAQAEEAIDQAETYTMLFLDPARRDAHGGRTVLMADCTPDVCALLPRLMPKARFLMLKLSPMLDWHRAVADLQGTVREVHIVAVGGECKELLLVLCDRTEDTDGHVRVVCVDIRPKADADGRYARSEFAFQWAAGHGSGLALPTVDDIRPGEWLYEPNAAIMKAGCWAELARAYGVVAVSHDSHLFLSGERVDGFPGRTFEVRALTTMNRRQLRDTLGQLRQANIAVRNFPMTVAELRRRLKLRDGGDSYLFGTTTSRGEHVIICATQTNVSLSRGKTATNDTRNEYF